MHETTDWHREDVKAAIRKTGLSCEALSERLGYQKSCVRVALRRPWPKLEALIALHLDVSPWTIWPSRYDALFRPLKGPPGRHRPVPSSPAIPVTHRKTEEAA